MSGRSYFRLTVKMKAKEILARNFTKTALAVIAQIILIMIFSYLGTFVAERFSSYGEILYVLIEMGVSFLSLIVAAPMYLGICQFCIKLEAGTPMAATDIFTWFGNGKKAAKSVGLAVSVFFISLFWSVIFSIIPSVIIYFLLANDISLALSVPFRLIIGLVGAAVALLALYMVNGYQLAYVLLAEDPDRKVFACLKESKALVKPYKTDFFIFTLSFIGWYLLASFTCGLVFIYLYPYLFLSQIIFAKRIRELNGAPVKNPTADDLTMEGLLRNAGITKTDDLYVPKNYFYDEKKYGDLHKNDGQSDDDDYDDYDDLFPYDENGDPVDRSKKQKSDSQPDSHAGENTDNGSAGAGENAGANEGKEDKDNVSGEDDEK